MMLSAVRQNLLGFMQKRRSDLFILLILSLFFAILFRTGLFGGKFALIGDPLRQLYPIRTIAWGMIKEGTLPLWTPMLLSGYPLSGMAMLGIAYPLTWGYFFLPGYWAEQIYILAPYLLSSIFTYAYLREVGRSYIASLLGGLVFGYGGFMFSPIGLTGVHVNSALWLPLLLVGVERARKRPFLPCLLITTGAYTMSILAGSGQLFVYAGLVATGYGIFLCIFPNDDNGLEFAGHPVWRRLRPLAVILGSIALSGGLAAFQILETWRLVKLSVRNAYPYEYFTEGSFTLGLAFRSLLEPLTNYWDSSTFAPLLALGLAIVAITSAILFRPRFRPEVFFWAIVAVVAWVLILGNNTPIFDIYIKIPFVSRFRYPSRHSMEWTFAIGVLAAYGWDVVESLISRVGRIVKSGRASLVWSISLGSVCLLISGAAGFYWWKYASDNGIGLYGGHGLNALLHYPYLGWKLAFTGAIISALLLFSRLANQSARIGLLAVTVAFYCFVEPYIWLIKPVVIPLGVGADHFDGSVGEATKFLQKRQNERSRNYTLINPYAYTVSPGRGADPLNWTVLTGLEEINGYESLIMNRYSVALRNLPLGTVNAEPFIWMDYALLDSKSHVLDLLNNRFITAFSNFERFIGHQLEKDGIVFYHEDLVKDLKLSEPYSLDCGSEEADTLALVTTMAFSGNIKNETPVAKISVRTIDGRVIERYLLAGVGTSEWAYERPDVRATIQHALAPIFDSLQYEDFRSNRYLARIDLGERVKVARIDVVKLVDSASVGLWKASLHDSATHRSSPLPQPSSERWRKIYDKDEIIILENLRALPRAWLVPKAEALDTAEALRRIRGDSDVPFDPREVALVEIEPHKLPALSGAPLSNDSYARIVTYEPNRLVIETNCDKQAMLVVSEMHYPGWVARIDGVKTPIHTTDFLLRGIVTPAGLHRVEMEFHVPGMRNGAIISLFTLLFIGALAIYAKRPRQPDARRPSSEEA
jgi:hypothetical protein